ncbi:unnamed protein product, partial [Parascedosporium putredinis]
AHELSLHTIAVF